MSTQTKTDDLSSASLMDERLLDRAQEDEDGFTVRSEADARKAFRAIQAAEEKIKKLTAEMNDEIKTVEDFYQPKIERAEDTIEFLESRIRSFVESTDESVSTPHGKAHTATRTKWDWQVSRDKLVQFAKAEYPDLVETDEKVSKTDLKQAVKEDWDDRYDQDPPVVERKHVESFRCYTT